MGREYVDLDLYLHHETKVGYSDEGAILISDDGNSDNAKWVPKSIVEFEQQKGQIYMVTMSVAKAQELGFI